jgi:hypothetical protein
MVHLRESGSVAAGPDSPFIFAHREEVNVFLAAGDALFQPVGGIKQQ